MPCRASASRCRVQVTSNVRHPNKTNQKPSKTRTSGKNPRQCIRAGNGVELKKLRRRMKPLLSASKRMKSKDGAERCKASRVLSALRVELPRKRREHAAASWLIQPPQAARRSPGANLRRPETQNLRPSGLPYSPCTTSYGSIQNMVAALVHIARLPNPSVNLTRNSVPRWPSEARYAHNAPLVHRVALPRAGYLKR
jgi:hypothetical protein